MSQAWTVLSGKGGVGKSTVSVALGMALARRRLPCCLVDADLGLRSLDMLMNLHSRVVYDVLDVARKDCKLKYALIRHTEDGALWLLPAAQEGQPGDAGHGEMERIVKKLKKRMAYVLLDAPAGLGPGVSALLPASDHALVVTTPDDVAMRDAERAIALTEAAGLPRPMLVVNRVRPDMVARGEMYSPQAVASALDVPLLGYVPEDRAVLAAAARHESFMDTEGPAKQAMERIAQRFLGEFVPMPTMERKLHWWQRGRTVGIGVYMSGVQGPQVPAGVWGSAPSPVPQHRMQAFRAAGGRKKRGWMQFLCF